MCITLTKTDEPHTEKHRTVDTHWTATSARASQTQKKIWPSFRSREERHMQRCSLCFTVHAPLASLFLTRITHDTLTHDQFAHWKKTSYRDLLCWHLSASRWFTSCYADKSDPDNSDPEARWWWFNVVLEVKVERGQSLWHWNAKVTGKSRSDDSECTLTGGNYMLGGFITVEFTGQGSVVCLESGTSWFANACLLLFSPFVRQLYLIRKGKPSAKFVLFFNNTRIKTFFFSTFNLKSWRQIRLQCVYLILEQSCCRHYRPNPHPILVLNHLSSLK